jgi:flagellar biosynthesis protein FlhB
MAEGADRESQTEEPTEKKIGDELERGNVPFSKEAAMFTSVSAMLIIAAFMAKDFIGSTTILLGRLIGDPGGLSLRNGYTLLRFLDLLAGICSSS